MVVKKKLLSLHRFIMVAVAQLVRASDCGPEGRRFDPGQPPTKKHIPFGMCFLFIHYMFSYFKIYFWWYFTKFSMGFCTIVPIFSR